MTEIDIAHYRKGDVLQIPGYDIPTLDSSLALGDSYTGLVDEVPVFCCGIALYWPGHAEGWLIMRTPENRYIGAFGKIRDITEWLVQKHNLFRISIHCAEDWGGARRVAEHLGFSLEGVLKNYGPKRETYNLYGRVWQ